MKKVTLKKSGLTFTRVGLGTNSIGGHNIYPNIDENVSKEIVKQYLKSGGTFIDTAYFYGLGCSEELIGEVLLSTNTNEDVIIATKASFVFEHDQVMHDNSPAFLIRSVKEALNRLQRDVIDVFYIHFPDENTPKEQAVSALEQLKQEGLIKAIAVSNFSLDQLKEANKDGLIDMVSDRYNLFMQNIDQDYIDYMLSNDIAFIPYSPLASGLLTGKYTLETQLSERQQKNPLFIKENYANNLKKIEVLRKLANKKDTDVSSIALAWLLSLEFVTAIIPGAKSPEQVLKNIACDDILLSDQEISLINETFNIKG